MHDATDGSPVDRRALEAERAGVMAEIRAYPPPIAGCDAQFEWLLARRREIDRLLAQPGR